MSSIIQQFGNMLLDYTKEDMVHNTLLNHDYLIKKLKKDPTWADGNYKVPFVGYGASSVMLGAGLPASSDVNMTKGVTGTIDEQVQFKGSLKFLEKDIRVSKKYTNGPARQSYMKSLIAKEVMHFTKKMQQMLSITMINGAVGTMTNAGNALGLVEVNNIEVYDIKQKLVFREAATPAAAIGYIQNIDMNTNVLTVTTDFEGTTPLDFTGIGAGTLAGDKIYLEGAVDLATGALQNELVTMRGALLSASNGGTTDLHNITKTDYPFLQATNVDGSSIDASNIIVELFKAYSKEINRKGKMGMSKMKANQVLVSLDRYVDIVTKTYEDSRAFNVIPNETSKKHYPYQKITLGSTAGVTLDVIEVPELDNDIIPFINPSTISIASEGNLDVRGNQNGDGSSMYYERNVTDEHLYLKDYEWDLNIAYLNPQANGIIHSVSY